MGRKEHLSYTLCAIALPGINNDKTKVAYKRAIKQFEKWGKVNGVCKLADVTTTTIQKYTDDLMKAGYSPSSIHTKLAPLCKAIDINMADIEKPLRTADTITRGRRKEANQQGKREESLPQYARLVELQRAVGIRRAELGRLTGKDLVEDESGHLCVYVRRGKGGKDTLQRVLEGHEDVVKRIFAEKKPEEKIFNRLEMSNHINLHRMRAEAGREAYEHYLQLDDEGRAKLRKELIDRWDALHYTDEGGRRAFIDTLNNDSPYYLRGENRAKAERLGLPVAYDRLSLMAVSVFHLSHWRLNVTVENYIVQ